MDSAGDRGVSVSDTGQAKRLCSGRDRLSAAPDLRGLPLVARSGGPGVEAAYSFEVEERLDAGGEPVCQAGLMDFLVYLIL